MLNRRWMFKNIEMQKQVFVFLNIYDWFNITDIILRSPDDGSLELKRYSVDFVS